MNDLQKQHGASEAQAARIAALESQVDKLSMLVAAIERQEQPEVLTINK